MGGSSKVMLAAADALRLDHEVTLRAPFAEATSRHFHPLPVETIRGGMAKFFMMLRLLRILLLETVWLRGQQYDVYYVGDTPSLYVYGLLAKLFGAKLLWHVHFDEGRGLIRWLRNWLCHGKVYISRFTTDETSHQPWWLVANPLILPDDLQAWSADKMRDVAVLGTLSERKNQKLAIDAAGLLHRQGRPVRLHLFGGTVDPQYVRTLRSAISKQGLDDRVIMHGAKPLAAALSEAGLVIVPSLFENQPLVVIEALAAGWPIVVSDIPAHRELFQTLGLPADYLVPLTDEAFASWMDNPPPPPDEEMTQKVRQIFSMERFSAEIRTVFRAFAG